MTLRLGHIVGDSFQPKMAPKRGNFEGSHGPLPAKTVLDGGGADVALMHREFVHASRQRHHICLCQ